jgi:hypothetical protein
MPYSRGIVSNGQEALSIGHGVAELWPGEMGAIVKVVRLSHVQDRLGPKQVMCPIWV